MGLNMKKHGFSILIIAMLFAGCSSRSVMVDVKSPGYLIDRSIIVPEQGVIVTSPLHLVGRVDILGGGPIIIKGDGRIVVEKDSKVVIRNVDIKASEIRAGDGESPVYFVAIHQGQKTSFTLEGSKFLVDVPYEKNDSSDPWDQASKYFAIGIVDAGDEPSTVVNLAVRNTSFINKNSYSSGAMNLIQNTRLENDSVLVGEIVDSQFEGFHGVISANKMKGFKVSGNQLSRNSFANIFVGGDDVEVSNNKIYYPGHGTTGDGITVLGRFVNGRILGNTIFVGSCFGMLFRGDEISNLLIEGNSIINGVTTAIQIEGVTSKARDIVIRENVMAGSYGFAISFLDVENSIIERNNFSENAKGFPSQVYMEKSTGVVLSNNLSAAALTPKWASGLELYRSHVKPDNTSFTLPGAQ